MNTFLARPDLFAAALSIKEKARDLSAEVLKSVTEDPRDKIIGSLLDAYTVEELVDGLIAVTATREAIAREQGDIWEAKKWAWHAARFREVKLQNEIHANKQAV